MSLMWLLALPTAQAGVLLAATRLIHDGSGQSSSLMLANTNAYPVLVQAWVDDGSADPDQWHAPYVVLPPVFRMEAGGVRGIRLLHDGSAMAGDRESVHWLNVHEVPPHGDGGDDAQARIRIALTTQIKVFHRPAGLEQGPDDLAAGLSWSLQRAGRLYLVCHNATPFHASFTRVVVAAGHAIEVERTQDMMVAPYSSRRYALLGEVATSKGAKVIFERVDDSGYSRALEMPLAH